MTNNGTITQTNMTGDADGIAIANNSSIGGNVINSGTITIATPNGYSEGIFLDSLANISGNIINSGTITVTGGAGSHWLDGIDDYSYTANITNNGTITVTASNGTEADGLDYYPTGTGTSTIINTGTLMASSDYGEAYGVYVSASGAGTINLTNSGMISSMTADTYDYAIFIGTSGTGTINLTNSGTISSMTDDYYAYSVYIAGTSAINLTNSGTISGTAIDDGFIETAVITSGSAATSTITNSGTISSLARDGSVGFYSLEVDNYGAGGFDIINSGRISGVAGADGAGYTLLDFGRGTITNTGTISAMVGNGGEAWGVQAGTSNSASIIIINSGTITATVGACCGTYNGLAYGVYTARGGGGLISITNSGTIAATAGAGGTAYGIYEDIAGTTDTITNTGTITATAGSGGTAWSIYDVATVTIDQNGGYINGNVGLSGNGDVFDIAGGTVMGSVMGNVGGGNSNAADSVNVRGGTLAVPSGGSVSDIGSYTQGAGGTLSLGMTPSTSATISAANITLDGTLKVAPSGGGWVLNAAHTYTDIINAGSSLSGGFSSISTPALFTASIVPDGSKKLSLAVTEVAAGSSPAVNSFIAGLLGNGSNGATAQSLADGLQTLSAPQLRMATAQLTGPAIAQNIQAIRSVAQGFAETVEQRLLAGSGYSTSNIMSMNMFGQHMQVASLADTPIPMMPPSTDGGGWMRAFGSFASGAAQGGVSGFNQYRSGVIFGADEKLGDSWILGAAVQYARTSLSFTDGSASSDADSYNGLLYTGWREDRLYVNGSAGFGWDNYGSSRKLLIGGFAASPSGNFSGWNGTGSVETGYAFPVKNWTLTPFAGLDYTHTHTDGFTEGGDGVSNLIVQSSAGNSLITSLGIRAGTRIETKNNGTFLPEIHLGWEHETMDESSSINAAFVSAPGSTFAATGAQYGRDSAIVGASLTQELSRHSRVFLTWDAKVNGGYIENGVSGGVRWEF